MQHRWRQNNTVYILHCWFSVFTIVSSLCPDHDLIRYQCWAMSSVFITYCFIFYGGWHNTWVIFRSVTQIDLSVLGGVVCLFTRHHSWRWCGLEKRGRRSSLIISQWLLYLPYLIELSSSQFSCVLCFQTCKTNERRSHWQRAGVGGEEERRTGRSEGEELCK